MKDMPIPSAPPLPDGEPTSDSPLGTGFPTASVLCACAANMVEEKAFKPHTQDTPFMSFSGMREGTLEVYKKEEIIKAIDDSEDDVMTAISDSFPSGAEEVESKKLARSIMILFACTALKRYRSPRVMNASAPYEQKFTVSRDVAGLVSNLLSFDLPDSQADENTFSFTLKNLNQKTELDVSLFIRSIQTLHLFRTDPNAWAPIVSVAWRINSSNCFLLNLLAAKLVHSEKNEQETNLKSPTKEAEKTIDGFASNKLPTAERSGNKAVILKYEEFQEKNPSKSDGDWFALQGKFLQWIRNDLFYKALSRKDFINVVKEAIRMNIKYVEGLFDQDFITQLDEIGKDDIYSFYEAINAKFPSAAGLHGFINILISAVMGDSGKKMAYTAAMRSMMTSCWVMNGTYNDAQGRPMPLGPLLHPNGKDANPTEILREVVESWAIAAFNHQKTSDEPFDPNESTTEEQVPQNDSYIQAISKMRLLLCIIGLNMAHLIRFQITMPDKKKEERLSVRRKLFPKKAVSRPKPAAPKVDETKALAANRINVETVNKADDNGVTALMIAASEGKADMVKFLIQQDADVDLQNNDGYTALMIAAARGYTDVVLALLDGGADRNIKDNDGYTALMLAMAAKNTEVKNELLKARRGKKKQVI